jgi:hypothetical protein
MPHILRRKANRSRRWSSRFQPDSPLGSVSYSRYADFFQVPSCLSMNGTNLIKVLRYCCINLPT